MGDGDANGAGAHADPAERAVVSYNDRRRWVELHDVLHARHDVSDVVAVNELRRCSRSLKSW